jgi:hypothetical protein
MMHHIQNGTEGTFVDADGAHAAHRKPAELHRKHHRHHDAEPEARRGEEEHRAERDQIVPDRVDLDRCQHAGRHADEQSNSDCRQHQDQRRRKLLHDHIEHRRVLPVRIAEIEPHHRPDIFGKLHRHRLIDAVGVTQLIQHLRVGDLLFGRHDVEQAPRRQMDQNEIHHDDREDQRNDLHEPADDDATHVCLRSQRSSQTSAQLSPMKSAVSE